MKPKRIWRKTLYQSVCIMRDGDIFFGATRNTWYMGSNVNGMCVHLPRPSTTVPRFLRRWYAMAKLLPFMFRLWRITAKYGEQSKGAWALD